MSVMNEQPINPRRRRFLVIASNTVGGMALTGMATPLLLSMLPSRQAETQAGPVEVDISKLEAGQHITVMWRGKPVSILHRTPAQLAQLAHNEQDLLDPLSDEAQQPRYCQNAQRSIKPEILIHIGICTHLGCVPIYRPESAPVDLGEKWRGGFFCPCHGSKYDLAARVFKNMAAPKNMEIPAHYYLSETVIRIGEEHAV